MNLSSVVISAPYAVFALFLFVSYFLVYPVIVYFHDAKGLRRFPNMTPFAGMSSIPFMALAHTGARSTHLTKMHKKYPVVRTGPNTLSYGDLRAIKDIYGHNTPCSKDASYIVSAGSHFHLADVIDRHDHSRKRKVLSSAYAIKNLEGWEHKVADKTARMIKHFDRCCTAPLPAQAVPTSEDVNLDYRKWANYFSIDAIADIGLSEKLGFLDNDSDMITGRRLDGTQYICEFRNSLYQNARKQSLLLWPYTWYPIVNKLVNIIPFYGRMGQHSKNWDGIPIELAHRRLQRYRAGEKLDDFFQALMEDKSGAPNNLEWGEIVAEVSIMMNAGSATTAIAMTNVLYNLLKTPLAMEKLVDELDSALEYDDSPVVGHDKVKHLPYLRACLDESLRLFPPTPHGLPRETPAGGMRILDQYIPGGVSVSISALVAHRDEKIFPQADRYIPERWLDEEGKALQPYFLSFSTGARGCIGRNISYLEQTVTLASVLRRYRFALRNPGFELERLETMNWLIKELPVKVWRRSSDVREEKQQTY